MGIGTMIFIVAETIILGIIFLGYLAFKSERKRK